MVELEPGTVNIAAWALAKGNAIAKTPAASEFRAAYLEGMSVMGVASVSMGGIIAEGDHPEAVAIAQSVAAATAHHSSGTTSDNQRMRPRTSTSVAMVPIAVGSGATPKISAVVHERPASGASRGYPTTEIASNAIASQKPGPLGGEKTIRPARTPRPSRSRPCNARADANP